MVWLAGCASVPKVAVVEPVGPAPGEGRPGSGNGDLVIYSARVPAYVDINEQEWRWNNDFGRNGFLYERAHSSYTIYDQHGDLVKHVRNARSQDDATPTTVALPPGSYRIEANAVDCKSDVVKAVMTAVIQPGETTVADLEGGWSPAEQYQEAQVAKLPCGRVIGWRAPQAGFAGSETPL